jgi:hypothetical protein
VVVERVPGTPLRLLAEAVQEAEGGEGLEDRRPHRVEVDGGRHHAEVHLVRRKLRRRHLADVERLARVLVGRLDALPHRLLGAQHVGGPVALGDRERGDVLAGRAPFDGVEEVLHGRET